MTKKQVHQDAITTEDATIRTKMPDIDEDSEGTWNEDWDDKENPRVASEAVACGCVCGAGGVRTRKGATTESRSTSLYFERGDIRRPETDEGTTTATTSFSATASISTKNHGWRIHRSIPNRMPT